MTEHRYFYYVLLTIILFLYYLIWIFHGFDVTDTGYHLTCQAQSFRKDIVTEVPEVIFLSNFAGGMWLALSPGPSLLWARAGYVFLGILNALIVFRILSGFFDKRKVFFVVLLTSIYIDGFAGSFPDRIIHYYTFPALLINLQLLLFMFLIKTPIDDNRFKLNSILIGFLAVPLVLSRLSAAVMFGIPIVVILYYRYSKRSMAGIKIAMVFGAIGLAVSAVIFSALYSYIGFMDTFITWIRETAGLSEPGYVVSGLSMRAVMETHLFHWFFVFGFMILILILLLIISKLKNRMNEPVITITIAAIIIAIFSTGFYWQENLGRSNILFNIILDRRPGAFIPLAWIIIISLMFMLKDRGKTKNMNLLLLVSVFITITSPAGSTTGLYKSLFDMWLALPLVFLLAMELEVKIKKENVKRLISARTMLVLLVVIAICSNSTYVYRDSQNRMNLDTEFTSTELNNIYSTGDRVEVVDELIWQIKNYTEKDDPVLIVGEVPMFYYLTETRPAYGEPWLFRSIISLEEIKYKHNEAINNSMYPKLFIYNTKNPESWNWPNNNGTGDELKLSKLEFLENEFVNNLNYTRLWENEVFVIYGNPIYYSQ